MSTVQELARSCRRKLEEMEERERKKKEKADKVATQSQSFSKVDSPQISTTKIHGLLLNALKSDVTAVGTCVICLALCFDITAVISLLSPPATLLSPPLHGPAARVHATRPRSCVHAVCALWGGRGGVVRRHAALPW